MESLRSLRFLLLGLFLFLDLEQSHAQSYKALVVASSPQYSPNQIPEDIEEGIKKDYVAIIEDESQAAYDIIVFPEHGITTLEPNERLRSNLDAFSIPVPDVGATTFSNIILSGISSAAIKSKAYVVINVLEKFNASNGIKYYSTDVVFDQDGALAAKCRKKYLYKEKNFDKGELNQNCNFEANFKRINVKVPFALLFDTDLLTLKNESIEHAILTSSLPNTSPLSFGLSLQAGYAVRNKVNLLASGYTELKDGYGGTGVYLRNGSSLVTYGSQDILRQNVPLRKSQDQVVNVVPSAKSEVLQKIAYEKLSTLATKDRTAYSKFGGGESYCKLHMDSSGTDITPYNWVALSGTITLLGQQKEVIICALIKPEESKNEIKNVDSITIEAIEKKDNIIQILPLSLGTTSNSKLIPTNFQFTETTVGVNTNVSMKLTTGADISVFGVLIILKSSTSFGVSLHIISHLPIVGLLTALILFW